MVFLFVSDQQAGLLGENPLAALPLQHGVNMLGDLPHGTPSGLISTALLSGQDLFILLPGPVVLILSVLSDTGAMAPGLGMQTDPLGPIKPPSLGRTFGREPESATAPNGFLANPSPALQGLGVPLLGSVLGADGSTLPPVRDFFQPGKAARSSFQGEISPIPWLAFM